MAVSARARALNANGSVRSNGSKSWASAACGHVGAGAVAGTSPPSSLAGDATDAPEGTEAHRSREANAARRLARVAHDEQLRSVSIAMSILECFTVAPELGPSAVAREVGIAKSTASRMLAVMAARGMLERRDG